jgi:hypothetical protein
MHDSAHLLYFCVLANQLLHLYFIANILDGHLIFFLYCSIEFDRDDELFATAGVSKRIKVFEFSTVSLLCQDNVHSVVHCN